MVIKNVNLETVCGITSRLPENDKQEVAFAGKSNVGKSSLINALMNRKSLARTSGPCRLDGRRESCGPCADHDHIIAFCLHLQDLLYWRYTVLGLYPHPAL